MDIEEDEELDEKAVVRNFRTTAADGKNYNVKYYNLDMILSTIFQAFTLDHFEKYFFPSMVT